MSDAAILTRPELTMPAAEAALLASVYAGADVILEYGSGGSTALAAELPGRHVFSVESDRAWADRMRAWFAANPPAPDTSVEVVWSDIGPTKEWGHPVDHAEWKRFSRYPLEVWDLALFRQPQAVLVDGRFRAGCALATLFRTAAPLTLLFDDYAGRRAYHMVEDFLGRPEITGRMARFNITPQAIDPKSLLRIVQTLSRPL